jgi:hypothetical protein
MCLIRYDVDAGVGFSAADRDKDQEAFMTLITTKDYIQGAVVVARALRAFGTEKPIVALVAKGLLSDASVVRVLKNEVCTSRLLDASINSIHFLQSCLFPSDLFYLQCARNASFGHMGSLLLTNMEFQIMQTWIFSHALHMYLSFSHDIYMHVSIFVS